MNSKKQSKDLFDDTTMTFGEHLEELRIRLWRAIVGLLLVSCLTMYYGDFVMAVVRKPIEDALKSRAAGSSLSQEIGIKTRRLWNRITGKIATGPQPKTVSEVEPPSDPKSLDVQIQAHVLLSALHQADPERFSEPKLSAESDKPILLKLIAPEFATFRKSAEQQTKPVVLTVQEGFMTWLWVSFIAGLVLASPWVFYQIWLFIAAGLYPHEQKYVYIFLPMSTVLFLTGAAFCFFCVFPFVLDFLLGFAYQMELQPQIRLADWITFAVTLPLMFGLSFQLPLVMLFLERISVLDLKAYREKRRIAIFVITILSMVLTPAEPYSMLMMMMPLIVLYELGILICQWFPRPKPFDDEPTTAIATT